MTSGLSAKPGRSAVSLADVSWAAATADASTGGSNEQGAGYRARIAFRKALILGASGASGASCR
jgi:hypothetical protein